MRAVNAVGGGGAAQVGATPSGAPTAPQNLAAAPDDEQVELTWEAPADTGGFDIEKYQYRQSDDGGSTWNPDWTDVAGGATVHTYTAGSLTNGTALHVRGAGGQRR